MWVYYHLQRADYDVAMSAFDVVAGMRLTDWLNGQAQHARHVLVLVSLSLAEASEADLEWPKLHVEGRTLPLVIEPGVPAGLLRGIEPIDVTGLDETAAAERLLRELDAAGRGSRRPVDGGAPPFPPALAQREGTLPAVRSVARSRVVVTVPRPEAGESPPTLPGLPPVPRCIGREDVLRLLVAALTGSGVRPVVVFGGPGIGKTTVAARAVHERAVEKRFRARRWFVGCEGATSAAALLAALAAELEVTATDAVELRRRVRRALTGKPALVVLDNFETPLSGADAGLTEELVHQLASIPSLRLIATVRGREFPPSINWQPLEIVRLDDRAAKAAFLAVARPGADGADLAADPDLPGLLDAMDGMPLAVHLLATRAQGQPDLRSLYAEWQDKSTAILRRLPTNSRLSSVDVSIETALDHPRITDRGRHVLSLLAIFPGGMLFDHLEEILPEAAHGGIMELYDAALASQEDGRIRTLVPIREYIAREYPPTPEVRTGAASVYCAFAIGNGRRIGREGGAQAVRALTTEAGNLPGMIMVMVGRSPERAVEAALAVAKFERYTGSGTSGLLSDLLARLPPGLPGPRARLTVAHGEEMLARRELDQAAHVFGTARRLFEVAGDPLGEARCAYRLGVVLRRLANAARSAEREDLLARAIAFLEKSRELFARVATEDERLTGEANCLYDLGRARRLLGAAGTGTGEYQQAHDLYLRTGEVLGQANCELALGNEAFERGRIAAASSLFQQARKHYLDAGNAAGEAESVRRLGDAARDASRLPEAEQLINQSLGLFREIGSVAGEARCERSLGYLAVKASDDDRARRHFDRASVLFRTVPDPHAARGIASAVSEIGRPRSKSDGDDPSAQLQDGRSRSDGPSKVRPSPGAGASASDRPMPRRRPLGGVVRSRSFWFVGTALVATAVATTVVLLNHGAPPVGHQSLRRAGLLPVLAFGLAVLAAASGVLVARARFVRRRSVQGIRVDIVNRNGPYVRLTAPARRSREFRFEISGTSNLPLLSHADPNSNTCFTVTRAGPVKLRLSLPAGDVRTVVGGERLSIGEYQLELTDTRRPVDPAARGHRPAPRPPADPFDTYTHTADPYASLPAETYSSDLRGGDDRGSLYGRLDRSDLGGVPDLPVGSDWDVF